jgi:hypothetical protein
MNVHGDRRRERSVNTWSGLRGWESDPELLKTRLVIGGNDALTNLMRFDSRFKVVYEDAVAVVFCCFHGWCLVESKISYLNCHSRQA